MVKTAEKGPFFAESGGVVGKGEVAVSLFKRWCLFCADAFFFAESGDDRVDLGPLSKKNRNYVDK